MPEDIPMSSTERVELTGRPFSKNDCAKVARSASAMPPADRDDSMLFEVFEEVLQVLLGNPCFSHPADQPLSL